MKILIVDTTIQGPLIGGGHIYLPGLMKGLINKGHEVHFVIAGTPDKKVATQIRESGAIVHKSLWKKNTIIEKATIDFAKWVNDLMPDIYLISAGDIGWVVVPYLNASIATLTIGHTDSEIFYSPARHYRSFLTSAIGVSNEIVQQYISTCGFSASQVEWIPYGVEANPDPPQEELNDKILKIIYVGRIEEQQKRVSVLSAVARKLTEENVNFHLKIVGDGTEMPTLRDSLLKEIEEEKVELTGWLPSREVIDALRKATVFILTSDYEGFCIALIEAMANGCCPVVTDIRSGNSQLIQDGQNGYLIEIDNVDLFVEKLKWLSGNPAEVLKMRKAAWETGKGYSVERMVENYEKWFIKSIGAAKKTLRRPDADFPIMESCRSKYPKWLRSLKVMVKELK